MYKVGYEHGTPSIIHDVQLLTVIVEAVFLVPNETTSAVVDAEQRDGTCKAADMVSQTVIVCTLCC